MATETKKADLANNWNGFESTFERGHFLDRAEKIFGQAIDQVVAEGIPPAALLDAYGAAITLWIAEQDGFEYAASWFRGQARLADLDEDR